jgi:hypothetical protein
MAQVTIYLSDEVAEAARLRARQARKSLSAYISEVLSRETSSRDWPQDLVDLLRQRHGDLAVPEDRPPEDVEPLA